MNKTILITLSLCLFPFIGCKKTTNQIPQSIIDEVTQLSMTPDSLLSPTQLSTKKDIYEIIKRTTKVKNNKLVTTATQNDFEQKGMSKYYYYILLKNIKEINSTLDTNPYSMQEMYDQILQNFSKNLESTP